MGLVGNNTDGATFDFCEASDNVFSKGRHNLVEFISVAHSLYHSEHVIGLVGDLGDNIVQEVSVALVLCVAGGPSPVRAFGAAVLRQKAKQFSGGGDGFDIVGEDTVGDTRDLTVHLGTTELLLGDFFIGYGFHHIGACNKHVAGILHHEDKIC